MSPSEGEQIRCKHANLSDNGHEDGAILCFYSKPSLTGPGIRLSISMLKLTPRSSSALDTLWVLA